MLIDNGIIAGNICNKFESRNPLIQLLTNRFLKSIKNILNPYCKEIENIREIGCGEGYLSSQINSWGYKNIKACDVSKLIIEKAKNLHKEKPIDFYVKSIYDLNGSDAADLLICSEVLEHLENPDKALQILSMYSRKYCLLTVPQEPGWRIANVLRGKYIKDLGNTPGHLNHWSSKTFKFLVQKYFKIITIKTSFPWIILLGTRR
ncbi:MAG TPA: class I SAM-dependent methyltransferase [Candidatus Omnitrophota bacterium]|nr:class I SAM-dependent methyltransferase [Candidatus Omnitrophota bacterium]